MKKFLPILVVGILVISGVGAIAELEDNKEILLSENIIFSQPNIIEKEEYVSIELAEATCNSIEENKPMIPSVTKVYTFPLGTCINDVKVTFSKTIEKKIEKFVMVSPEIIMYSTEYCLKNNIKQKNEIDYSDIDIYPESRFNYRTAAGLKDGERVIYLTISIKPIQYKPKENLILYSESANVIISYIPPNKPITFPDVYDLLIITPEKFKSALQRLVDFKNNLNPPVKTVMVTLDEIPSGVGVDTQEDIKFYIKDAIENWGIDYLLLVGAGIEGEELFPVRKAWFESLPHELYFPSDLYYADIYNGSMGFSDWDYDEDGKFAEYPKDKPDIDILPDVYLGKLPCNNVAEVNYVINKIIYYKKHNRMTERILQVGADSAPGSGVYEGEYANQKVLDTLPGYSSIRLWGTNGKLTKQEIANGFKSAVDFVDLSGHGSYLSWATHPPDKENVWIPEKTLLSPWTGFLNVDLDIYIVNNVKKLPVVVFTACSNNKYTIVPDCIGWKLVSKEEGGSIATFAEAGIGYGPTGPQFIEAGIGLMEVTIFKEFLNTKILGQVWNNCIETYYTKFAPNFDRTDWQTMIEFLMFGDPTLVIEDGDDPVTREINRPLISQYLVRLIEQFPILSELFKLIIAKIS